jgi:hypothetical protein
MTCYMILLLLLLSYSLIITFKPFPSYYFNNFGKFSSKRLHLMSEMLSKANQSKFKRITWIQNHMESEPTIIFGQKHFHRIMCVILRINTYVKHVKLSHTDFSQICLILSFLFYFPKLGLLVPS